MKKGLGGWVQIFKGGRQVDASGRPHNGDALIQQAVANFNAADHEPPAVIGHPKTDDPAYAWVSDLRSVVTNGATFLEAKFRDVAPSFEAMVKDGLYKKRSAAFYPDGSLRHVGFLGAAPPAVKGLANVAFREGDGPTFEFSDDAGAGFNPDPTPLTLSPEDNTMNEIEELKQKLAAAETAKEAAETQAKTFKEQADQATLTFAEAEHTRQREAIASTIEQGIKDGKILPAWKTMGLATFMEGLAGVESKGAVLTFAEGDKRDTVDQAGWFNRFIATFSAHPLFKEMVKPVSQGPAFADGCDFSELTKHV